jgi:DNA mismatch endonuclease (patch repair protein)
VADWLTRDQRTRNMSSIRSTGNRRTELRLIAILRAAKLAGWRRNSTLPGKPDLVWPSHRLVIFVDGCFWHGCPRCYRAPGDNARYWREKVRRNRRRDATVARRLRQSRWSVLRIWEHSLRRPAAIAARIGNALDSPASRPASLGIRTPRRNAKATGRKSSTRPAGRTGRAKPISPDE